MTVFLVTAVLVVIDRWLAAVYNDLMRGHNLAEEAQGGVDTQLTRRADRLPAWWKPSKPLWALNPAF